MQHIRNLIPDLTAKPQTTQKLVLSGWRPTIETYEATIQSAADACSKFVADMESGVTPYWLTLTGVNGCGKTMLMRQVLEQARRINPGNPKNNPIWPPDWANWETGSAFCKSRPYCLYFDERAIAKRMREGEFDLPASIRDDFFVAVDELGVARDPTNFVSDAISSVCENRLRGWTMFATNLTLAEIAERIDARVSSRLIRDGNKIVAIKANDYALRKWGAA